MSSANRFIYDIEIYILFYYILLLATSVVGNKYTNITYC